MKNKILLLLTGITLGLFSLFAQDLTTTVNQVVYDHCGEPFRNDGYFGAPWGAHEGGLHGVPSNYDWAAGARPSFWMDLAGNNAITSWGQVYEDAAESPVTNLRIHLRNHKLYAYADGNWILLDNASSNIQATYWAEDFTSSTGNAPSRDESANGGGISFPMAANYNLHWWDPKWPRSSLPSGYEAFFITCDIRLIPNTDPNVDLSQAKYLAGVSADAYPTTTSSGPGPWPSLSISRHKYITSEWQTITSYIAGPEPTSVSQYQTEIESRPLPPGVVTSSGQVAVTGVSVSPQSTSVGVGNTVQLTESVAPSNATDQSVTWTTSNSSVATVNSSGVVTGVAEGSATITVTTTDGGFTDASSVTATTAPPVTDWVEDFNDLSRWTVSTGSPVITSGELDIVQQTVVMTSEIIDISGASDVDISVIAEGYNPFIMEAADYYRVYYSLDGGSYQSFINRTDGFARTTLNSPNLSGSSLRLRIEAYTSFGDEHYYTDQIVVTMNGTPSTIAVTGVSVSPTSASVLTGETVQLSETVSPADATDQSVSWSSNNTSVATVNSLGLVTAQGAGSATITVTTTDGGFTANSTITVSDPVINVTSVSVAPTSASIEVGNTVQLSETVSPSDATDQSVTWSTSNSSVATVNSSGIVTGVAEGIATITVITTDGGYTDVSTITVTAAPPVSDWVEDFNDLSRWTVSTGSPVITSGELDIVQQTVVMTSEIIDISGAVDVDISVIAEGYSAAVMENADYYRVLYSLDGGSYQSFINITDGFSRTTFNSATLTGNSLRLRIESFTSWNDEHYYTDQIVVTLNSTPAGIDYLEDFNDNIAQNWTASSGTWNATGNAYSNSSTGQDEISIYNGNTFADFTYSVDAEPQWGNDYGVIFNFQDNNNYYMVALDASPLNAYLKKKINGTLTTIATSTYSGGGTYVTSNIEVINNGSTTSVNVNGSSLFSNVSTAELAYGKIGLYSSWNPLTFDNVSVNAGSTTKSGSVRERSAEISESENEIKVYPNPATNGYVMIELSEISNGSAILYDLQGKQVESYQILDQHTLRIAVDELKGMYVIAVRTENQSITLPVIIK